MEEVEIKKKPSRLEDSIPEELNEEIGLALRELADNSQERWNEAWEFSTDCFYDSDFCKRNNFDHRCKDKGIVESDYYKVIYAYAKSEGWI